MQHFTPSRNYMHYDDVPKPLAFNAGQSYRISEILPGTSGDTLLVRHPEQEDDVLLRPEKIAQCEGVY